MPAAEDGWCGAFEWDFITASAVPELAAPVPQVPWILDARVTCRAHGHHALLERRERAGHKALDAPRAVNLGRGWAGIKCGESCERDAGRRRARIMATLPDWPTPVRLIARRESVIP